MVEVNNLTKEKLPISRLKQLAQKVGGDRDISVAFLLPKEIALLNARYRNKQE